jgi:hypothetical protein
MQFDHLTEDNYLIFAIKNYENPQCNTYEDFEEDMKRFKYVKRLFKKYLVHEILRTNLILNHIIILFNVFGDAALPLLFFRIESVHWPVLKTFLVFLNRWPEGFMPQIPTDKSVMDALSGI